MKEYSQGVMSYQRASQAYTESAVLSASPAQLVVMLYDGAIRFLQQSSAALQADNKNIARQKMFRADSIINELNDTLDMEQGGEVADRLRAIYLWTKKNMIEGLTEDNHLKLDQAVESLKELREAWAQTANSMLES